jgi:hypothetical protein
VAERLAAAGIDADVAGEPEAGEIAIRLEEDDAAAVERATTLATRRAVVEIYDLEGSLVGPSLADGQVLAYRRLYELIVGRQSPARADDVEEWYLFDTKGDVRGGPAPTRDLLTPGGEPPLTSPFVSSAAASARTSAPASASRTPRRTRTTWRRRSRPSGGRTCCRARRARSATP